MEDYVSVDSWDVRAGRAREITGFLILQRRKLRL